MDFASLYIHIPFCKRKCRYCVFYAKKWQQEEEVSFFRALSEELVFYAKRFTGLKIKTLFIGGGSPSCISKLGLKQILEFVHNKLDLDCCIEKSIELNPEDVDIEKLKLLGLYGFNRVSLGAQSFCDEELMFLGRCHTGKTTIDAVALINSIGINNVNLDLIFGIPGSSVEKLKETIGVAVNLNVSHISAYSLSFESGSYLVRKGIKPVSCYEDFKQYRFVKNYLKKAGFDQYEVSSFSKKGFQCKHNLAYWEYTSFIGVGPSATSFFRDRSYKNVASLSKYIDNPVGILSKQLDKSPMKRSFLIKDFIVANLRLKKGFSVARFNMLFDMDFCNEYRDVLGLLWKQGLLARDRKNIRVSQRGLYLLNDVLIRFL